MISGMKLCTDTGRVAYLKSQCTMGNNKKGLLHNIIRYHRVDYAQNITYYNWEREEVAFNWEKLENNFFEDVLFGQHQMKVSNLVEKILGRKH